MRWTITFIGALLFFLYSSLAGEIDDKAPPASHTSKVMRTFLASLPSLLPIDGRMTSHFGYRRSPFTGRKRFHAGIDIASPRGTPILAAGGGTVIYAGYRSGFGKTIVINHGYEISSVYGHAAKILVKKGDHIEKGETIGLVGMTGRSTGPHLHYEVRTAGLPIDPAIDLIGSPGGIYEKF